MKSNAEFIKKLSSPSSAVRQTVFTKVRDDEVYKAAIYTIADKDKKVIPSMLGTIPTHLIREALDWFLQPQNCVKYGVFHLLGSSNISDKDFDRLLGAITLDTWKTFSTYYDKLIPLVAMHNIAKFSDRLLKINFKDWETIVDIDTQLRFVLGISDEDFSKNYNKIFLLYKRIANQNQGYLIDLYCENILAEALAMRLRIENIKVFSTKKFLLK